jgi:hypothetical protein
MTRLHLGTLFVFLLAFAGDGGTGSAAVLNLDCSSPEFGLGEEESVILHRDGSELHLSWLIADRPELWQEAAATPEALLHYREKVKQVVPDVSPLGLIRANREAHPWLEREHPAEARINHLVESGLGKHRPMNCIETQILAFQAARFPLYEQPTEIVALILRRTDKAGDVVKVFAAADDDSVVPKPDQAVTLAEADVAAGWRLVAVFHNHTFNHDRERGLYPVAAPSASDLQISVALAERLGLESILVADGFSTLELTAAEFRQLAEESGRLFKPSG